MKIKSKFLTSAVVLGLALPAAFPLVANAADTDAAANKSASVNVSEGSLTIATTNGNLEAPSFDFKANVSETAQNDIKTEDFSNTDTADKYTGSKLSVDDETGTGEGWNVTAKLSDLTLDDKTTTLAGAAMSVPASTADSITGPTNTPATTPAATLTAGGAEAKVFVAAKDAGMGKNTTDLSGVTMSLPSVKYSGNYTGTLTYTLTSGPGDTAN